MSGTLAGIQTIGKAIEGLPEYLSAGIGLHQQFMPGSGHVH